MLSDVIIAALIGAAPASCTLMLTVIALYRVWHVPHRLKKLQEQTQEIAIHTNSLTEKLLDTTATVALAQGIQQEKDRVAGDTDSAAIVARRLIATAEVAADKLLATAQAKKEGGSS